MIPLEMKSEIKNLHKQFFEKEFEKEFISLFMINNEEFDFQIETSDDAKKYLSEAKEEYNNELAKGLTVKNVCDNLKAKDSLLKTEEFEELLKLANGLLIEKDYSELLEREKIFGNYLIKLNKKIFNSRVIVNSYDEYKIKSDKIELIHNFEELFKDKLYKSRMCRTISINKFKKIEKENGLEKNKIDSENWCAYLYTYLLGIMVCPYCNSQYVYTYQNEERGRMRAELDHCFPKKYHPFLAVSLFNLVPSCSQCNGSLKGDSDIQIDSVMNLFTEKFLDKYKFYVYSEENIDSFIGKSLDYDLKIAYDDDFEDSKRLKAFIDSFHIENRYNFFKKYLNEQIYYQVNHSKSYNNFLQDLLRDLPDKSSIDEQKSKYIEERHENRILGKLISDILYEENLTIEHFETINYKKSFYD